MLIAGMHVTKNRIQPNIRDKIDILYNKSQQLPTHSYSQATSHGPAGSVLNRHIFPLGSLLLAPLLASIALPSYFLYLFFFFFSFFPTTLTPTNNRRLLSPLRFNPNNSIPFKVPHYHYSAQQCDAFCKANRYPRNLLGTLTLTNKSGRRGGPIS